jgi:hypothetical protein
MITDELKNEVFSDARKIMNDVYARRWGFKDVSDFLLLSYVCNGSITDYDDYLTLRKELILFFKRNLKRHITIL